MWIIQWRLATWQCFHFIIIVQCSIHKDVQPVNSTTTPVNYGLTACWVNTVRIYLTWPAAWDQSTCLARDLATCTRLETDMAACQSAKQCQKLQQRLQCQCSASSPSAGQLACTKTYNDATNTITCFLSC